MNEKQIDKKAIEEMAKHCAYYHNGNCKNTHPFVEECDLMCDMFGTFANLEKAGYRKQSVGECDFCKADHEKCGTCVKFFDYYEDGDGNDRCSTEYGNEKCAYYKPVHYCSNCGAKMKGGEE